MMQTDGSQAETYEAVTHDIRVCVVPEFLADQSNPESGRYFWAYHVSVSNEGPLTVQLQSRHWLITDGTGHCEEVQGPGVVGEQPILRPGDEFRYTSGCPLRTSSGFMSGSYRMKAQSGEVLDIEIPAFALDLPGARGSVN